MISDIRWFAPNRYGTLVTGALRRAGLTLALEGDAPARLAVAIDGQVAELAFRFASRHRCPWVLFLWDLPPWRLGSGRPDWVGRLGNRLWRLPRLVGGYPERAGFYSRLRYLAGLATAVWVPSRATAADVRQRWGIEPVVLPYCYDSDRFTPGRWQPAAGWRLVSVSRLVAHKNHAAVIRAAARLDPSATVHLIGQGPEADHLRALATRLNVTLQLDAHGVPDDAVVAAYRRASVVVAASRFEGFGLTPIEGLAVGAPVVAADIPPHREFLDPAVRFFALEDDQALVEAIRAARAAGPILTPALANLTIEAAANRLAAACRGLLGEA